MSTAPFDCIEGPDAGKCEKENLVTSALPEHFNQGTDYQCNYDENVIQPYVADQYCPRVHTKSNDDDGNRAFNPGDGEDAWCSVLITICGRFEGYHFQSTRNRVRVIRDRPTLRTRCFHRLINANRKTFPRSDPP